MAFQSNTSTLNFEGTAGYTSGDRHISTGQSNQTQPLSSAGMSYQHTTVHAVLPKMTCNSAAHTSVTMVGVGILPRVSGKGYGGASAANKLPSVKFSGSMTIPNIGRVAATLPTVTGAATALAGYTAQMNGVLPTLRGVGYGGANAANKLPRIVVSGHGFVMEHASAALVLPKLKMTGVGHRFSDTASAAIVLPKLTTGAQIRSTLIVLPRMVAKSLATNAGTAVLQGWVMNLENKAVTQFSNYAYRAFVRWHDRYYGVGMDGGLYLLEGDTDVGAPIPWAWETGLDDMDSNAIKGVSGVYVEGTIEAGAVLTIINDKKQRYTYGLNGPGSGSDQRRYRVITGKGIRTSNFGVGMSSTAGGYMEVDQVAPKFVVSKRNI